MTSMHQRACLLRRPDHQDPLRGGHALHRIEVIYDQVQEHLLQLNTVAQDGRQALSQVQLHRHVLDHRIAV